MHKYSVEMYIKDHWETHIRYYMGEIPLNDWRLCDVPNIRRNAKYLELTI